MGKCLREISASFYSLINIELHGHGQTVFGGGQCTPNPLQMSARCRWSYVLDDNHRWYHRWILLRRRWTENEYVKFLTQSSYLGTIKKITNFKSKMIFMQDYRPSHTAKLTKAFLERKRFKGVWFMEWLPQSPQLKRHWEPF